MLQILSKALKLACRRHVTLGIIWNKESYLSVGQFVSETHSCCSRFLPVQPRIWLFFSVEKASPPNFMQWEEGKKRKKWTEQEMMTQLYGNHFRTKTGDREPMTTSTLVQISGWKDVGVLWNSVQIQTCALHTKKKKKKKPLRTGMRRKNVDIIFVVMNVDIIWHLQTANSKQKPGLIGDIYFKVSVTYAIIKNTSTRLTTATLHPLHPIQTNLILLFWGRVL